MTDHSTAVQIDVYPDEFNPLLKILNRAIFNKEIVDALTDDEAMIIVHWLDDFKSAALEHAS